MEPINGRLHMSDPRRNEKEEEKREKEDEKRSEKTWDEKWHHNPVRVITLAIILIWAGVTAFLVTTSVLSEDRAWGAFLLGTGVILLVKAGFRMRAATRRPVGGTIIIGVILVAVGLGGVISWNFAWPVVLIAAGVIIVLLVFFRRK
jgi:cation transport ATPase